MTPAPCTPTLPQVVNRGHPDLSLPLQPDSANAATYYSLPGFFNSLTGGNAAWIGAKVEEEAEETARAGREESDRRLTEESADLVYHLGVLLYARGLTFADALRELTARMGR